MTERQPPLVVKKHMSGEKTGDISQLDIWHSLGEGCLCS